MLTRMLYKMAKKNLLTAVFFTVGWINLHVQRSRNPDKVSVSNPVYYNTYEKKTRCLL